MKVKAIMTAHPHSCSPQDSLVTAAQMMWDADCGSVAVVDDSRRVVGMITDRDICMAALHSGQPLRACTVESVMTHGACVCSPEDTVQDIEALMREKQLRRLPVIDRDGIIVGIVSLNDLALASEGAQRFGDGITATEVAATLAAVSRHRPNEGASEPR